MAGLKDIIPESLQGERMNDPSTWSGEGENIYGQEYGKKDSFGYGVNIDKQQEAKDLAAPYIREWSEVGAEDGSEWLGLIDAAHLHEAKIAGDEELGLAFSQMMEAHGVNILDLDLKHHNQKRRHAGLGNLAMPAQSKSAIYSDKGQELLGVKPEDVMRY